MNSYICIDLCTTVTLDRIFICFQPHDGRKSTCHTKPNLNKSFGELREKFKEYTGILLEISETTWSDGVNDFTPDNESIHCQLHPNSSNQYLLTITFNDQSIRFANGSKLKVKCINLQDQLNISLLKPELAYQNSYLNIYADFDMNWLSSNIFYREIENLNNWHRFSVWEYDRNILSITNHEAIIELYYHYTGVRLNLEYLDVEYIRKKNHAFRCHLKPNGKPNNPYLSTLTFDGITGYVSNQSIETIYIKTMPQMPFEYLKDYLWSRHRFRLEDSEMIIKFDGQEHFLGPGVSVPLNGFIGYASLTYPPISQSPKFHKQGEYLPTYFDLYFV